MSSPPRHVVVLFGSKGSASPGSSLAAETSRLRSLLQEHPRVTVITRGLERDFAGADHLDLAADAPSAVDRALVAVGAGRLHARLRSFPLGRLLNSLGPLDEGRVLWRAARRNGAVRAALKDADVVIAVDAAAVKTAWLARRRGWTPEAYYDHRAASFGLSFGVDGSTVAPTS
ncbi:hypothetical protein [Microcella alkalica]|uniref:hypothetical protein n=1 Tax=Microcella alkalica TaxID=355930 RepID=UPI00145DFCE4|nr:hypothetical protein [Microcella alkalica]